MEIKPNKLNDIRRKIENIAKKAAYWTFRQESVQFFGDTEAFRRNIECEEGRLAGVIQTVAILLGRGIAGQLDDYYDKCFMEQVQKLREESEKTA